MFLRFTIHICEFFRKCCHPHVIMIEMCLLSYTRRIFQVDLVEIVYDGNILYYDPNMSQRIIKIVTPFVARLFNFHSPYEMDI